MILAMFLLFTLAAAPTGLSFLSGSHPADDRSAEVVGAITPASPAVGLSVTLSINPIQLDQGQSLNVQTTVNGGTAPYSYAYSGLPPGCGGENQGTFSCNPSGSGTFNVEVTVTDSHGNQSSPSNSVSVTISSSSNGNGNGNGNGNNGGNSSSNPFSGLLSGLGGFFAIALVLTIAGFVTWILLVIGVWVIAVVLMRRLPLRTAPTTTAPDAKCAACSAPVPAGAKFCPQCGTGTAAKGA